MLDKFIKENFEEELKIDGVFAVTDKQALDLIKKLDKIKINVPNDVQVIGFDGSRPSCDDEVQISTIRQPIEQIAKEAVSALINQIENKPVTKKIIIPIKYIKGYTTK